MKMQEVNDEDIEKDKDNDIEEEDRMEKMKTTITNNGDKILLNQERDQQSNNICGNRRAKRR